MNWFSLIWHALFDSSFWMAWNLFLALVPLILSIGLFRLAASRLVAWWLGLFLFVAFLPNAPYILTDLIHLTPEIRGNHPVIINTLVILPKYFLFVLVGFEAYVLCLLNLGAYLRQQGLSGWIPQAELMSHGLSAIGIYLGRVERFNSWDIVTRPHHILSSVLESFFDLRPLLFMTIALLAITGLYWLLKRLTVAVFLQWRDGKMGDQEIRE